jgi:hypothetical protein
MTYLLLTRATGVAVATWPNYAGQPCRVAPTVKSATESSRLSTRCRQVGLGVSFPDRRASLAARGRCAASSGQVLYLAGALAGLSGLVVGLEVDAQARRWGRLVVVLLAGVCFLWSDVGLGEHLERMAGRRQPDRLGKVGAEVVSLSQRYGKR